MTTLTGGIRTRMINHSIFLMVKDSLEQLGWYLPDREHAPILFTTEPRDRDEQIQPNTITLSPEDTADTETGLGENSVEERATYYVDIYAENNALGLELSDDIRDILAGRMPHIGRDHSGVDVYDYRPTTPVKVGRVDFEDVVKDRALNFPKPWLKHWYIVRFDVIDTYGGGE